MHLYQRLNSSLKLAPSTRKILLVEDDPSFSEILQEFLTDSGYEVHLFNEVLDIHPLLEKFHPDLVILDYLLPVVNGGELCSQIKRNQLTCGLPVIMFSAYQKVLLSLGDYGCDVFISKPLDLNDLISKIEECIN
jgi:DNA-binding response OmpR family regulator